MLKRVIFVWNNPCAVWYALCFKEPHGSSLLWIALTKKISFKGIVAIWKIAFDIVKNVGHVITVHKSYWRPNCLVYLWRHNFFFLKTLHYCKIKLTTVHNRLRCKIMKNCIYVGVVVWVQLELAYGVVEPFPWVKGATGRQINFNNTAVKIF